MNLKPHPNHRHRPVLVAELLRYLNPQAGQTYLDVTAGAGGHAQAIATDQKHLTLIDADPVAVAHLQQQLPAATIYNDNFASKTRALFEQGQLFNFVLADLGVSKQQLTDASRGFSWQHDGPLDMRFNNQLGLTLQERLDRTTVSELTDIIGTYGEEPKAQLIASHIKQVQPQTTTQLAQLIMHVKAEKPVSKKHLHPATQTFMALRIWVNDELSQLADFLETAPWLLKPAGKLAVISFHSLEDRLVKRAFRYLTENLYESDHILMTKKPITPSITTSVTHVESRSAKLRVLQRKSL